MSYRVINQAVFDSSSIEQVKTRGQWNGNIFLRFQENGVLICFVHDAFPELLLQCQPLPLELHIQYAKLLELSLGKPMFMNKY